MEGVHQKLLKEYEDFETDLEVEQALEKVKQEWLLKDENFAAFAETLSWRNVELEPEKVEAQRRREAQATRFHQLCYPQHTCEWFVEGLDFCCNYWRYHFKRPLTPPPVPPPSPDASRKRPRQTPTFRDLPAKRRQGRP